MPENELTNFSLTFDVLFLKRVDLMMNAAGEDDIDKYFTNFKFALKMVMSYLDIQTRAAIEADYNLFLKALKKIEEDGTLNPESKKLQIRKIKNTFADGHNLYIFACFSRIGIIRIKEEGKLDFSVLDIDQMAQIVRGREKGIVKTATEVMKVD